MVALKTFFNTLNCIPIDLISERYNTFDDIKLKYEKYLGNNEKNKSIVAINADIRQSFYISTEVKSNKSDDSYLVSWDNTLYHLRDIVKEELELTKSYGVYKPIELANKLAFRDFRINKESVSDEIFAYADSGYNVSEKIKSLFDNVLTPYFASSKNKNSRLVVSVLKMQQASQDGREETNDNTIDKTNLERLFLSIVQKLDEYGCSKNDLTTFLSMEENNGFIIGLFEKAFKESNSSVYETISNLFCERLKESSNHKEREISLYSKSE